MLHIQKFEVNMVAENCYVVWDETRQAVIIDCGVYFPEEQSALSDYIAKESLTIQHLLNTHCHFDHIFGDAYVAQTYGVLPAMAEAEVPLYKALPLQIRQFLGRDMDWALPEIGKILREGDRLSFGHHHLEVIATPGHTVGGVCFYEPTERILFSGDILFQHSIGRTDFPGGNRKQLIKALQEKVLTLPDDVKVFPGHGAATTIREEKKYNYFLNTSSFDD